jgi:hypothetical protein
MLSAAHTLISLPFGIWLDNGSLIFLAAFVSHFLSDSLTHWNVYPAQWKKKFYAAATVDVVMGLVLAWFFLGERFFTLPIWLAIAGGNMPDILQESWHLVSPRNQQRYFAWAKPFFRIHEKLQKETVSVSHGLIWQVILVLAALLVIRQS